MTPIGNFSIDMLSYKYRNSHIGNETVLFYVMGFYICKDGRYIETWTGFCLMRFLESPQRCIEILRPWMVDVILEWISSFIMR